MGTYGELQKLNKVSPSLPSVQSYGEGEQIEVRIPTKLPINPPAKNRDTTVPRHHDTKQPRYHDTIIHLIRTAVKQFGKEAATHRFTLDEKKAIADVVYNYRRVGVKTSENEISRIGVNFMIEDYKANGEKSILNQVIKALNQ